MSSGSNHQISHGTTGLWSSLPQALEAPLNVGLLTEFALHKLGPKWSKRKAALRAAIELVLPGLIEEAQDQFSAWAFTPDNVAEANRWIWGRLGLAVTEKMQTVVDADEPIEVHRARALAARFDPDERPVMPWAEQKDSGDRQDHTTHDGHLEAYRSMWK